MMHDYPPVFKSLLLQVQSRFSPRRLRYNWTSVQLDFVISYWPKADIAGALQMSAFRGKADITYGKADIAGVIRRAVSAKRLG